MILIVAQQLFQIIETFQLAVIVWKFTADFYRLTLLVLVAPLADAVEVLQRKSHRIHLRMAVRAVGIGAVLFESLAKCPAEFLAAVVIETRHERRWRRRRVTEDLFENPFASFDWRGARGIRRDGEHARLCEQSTALRPRKRDALEFVTIVSALWPDVVNFAEPTVQVGEICIEQIEDAAVFADDFAEKETRLLQHGIP